MVTTAVIASLLLAACGQKGSLYLPAAEPPSTTPAASAPASQPTPMHSPAQPR